MPYSEHNISRRPYPVGPITDHESSIRFRREHAIERDSHPETPSLYDAIIPDHSRPPEKKLMRALLNYVVDSLLP